MDVFRAIRERRSVRKFDPEPVSEEDILQLLDAARWAPSGSNQQPWRFIVVSCRRHIEEMASAVRRRIEEKSRDDSLDRRVRAWLRALRPSLTFFGDAPVVIAVAVRPYEVGARTLESLESLMDEDGCPEKLGSSAAIQNLLLAAHALGYGACWMTGPLIAKTELESILGITAPWKLAAVIPLGHPVQSLDSRPRKPLAEIVTWVR
ncbi:MAG: nitroreductase family protein [Chloroflexi bacterium]|nr:nitroreductase family protein [Chloroflexota bacterium]